MARRRKRTRRSKARGFTSRLGIGKNNLIQVDSMIYGGLRARLSALLTPLTARIPLGNVADELGLGIFNWFVAKNMKGLPRDVAMKGLVIENARVGEAVFSGDIFSGFAPKQTATNGNKLVANIG